MKELKILIFVVVMGIASASLLIGVNTMTAPLVARNEELKLKTSILDVFDIEYDLSNVLKVFDENVKILTEAAYTFYNIPDGSVAFEFRGPGLWGPISCIIALENDLKTIRQIKITHQEETPGLGGRIAEENYLNQFKQKEIYPKIVFMPEGKASRKNEVDAITGATGSSRAFEKLINESVQKYVSVLKSNQ